MWMWDTPQGYYQIGVKEESQGKLAFTGPNVTKLTYNVMPFGPVNSPATFIAFIHDDNSTWKDLAHLHGVIIDQDTNTKIIVNNTVSWAKTHAYTMMYMECQLKICQPQNLSLSLKKLHIFPKQFKFVRIDICQDRNHPAMSKHQRLQHWPTPIIVRDVAKFVGLMQFYSRFIPHFEIQIIPLRDILCKDYSSMLESLWTKEAQAAFDAIRWEILDDPCLRRYNHCELLVLSMDFFAKGFGYVACQPVDDNTSLQAMHHQCMQGGSFNFIMKDPPSHIWLPSHSWEQEMPSFPFR
jgi:hypothetical protein